MLDWLLIKTIERYEKEALNVLSKIEFGVAIFCKKMALKAMNDGYPGLSSLLVEHSEDESSHGKMLASLANGTYRPTVKDNGAFISIFRGDTDICKNKSYPISNPLVIEWDSITFAGEKLVGLFENFDGMSKRYWSLKLFLGSKQACEYGWGDLLPFMAVLEGETKKLYSRLAKSNCSEPLKAIALKITDDESAHEKYLECVMFNFSGDLNKWKDRLWLAKLGLILDLIILWWNHGRVFAKAN